MLLNSFTSRTLSQRNNGDEQEKKIGAIWYRQAEALLTSCLSWVWRCMVSAFQCAEEWTSSGDTWEGKQSGPVGSECTESGKAHPGKAVR